MLSGRPYINFFIVLLCALAAVSNTAAEDKLLIGKKVVSEPIEGENRVIHQCLTPHPGGLMDKFLDRDKPWSLPKQALAADFLDTIKVLVLRFNFQYETIDDPNTTGRGWMNLAPFDSAAVVDSVGHAIDPPPHNAAYFSSHMEALKRYYEIVSEGKITLAWDIYPKQSDSLYELPHEMSYYGSCDFSGVVAGLEKYFAEGLRLADTASPDIDFSKYESIFMFHAGSDRQNDIGYPETCSDLFTGFIQFVSDDTVFVDNGTVMLNSALLMPETASQDNRATALNAVIAHEFGHQLGLVDLYSTATFMSQLGDFALMDDNGFGTGIDFGYPVGRVFGAIPLFPMAWSRAHLGFVDVYDFRQGTDIQVAAAEVESNNIKIARVPISDKEYYLLENRNVEVDGQNTGAQLDSVTNVILGPAYLQSPADTIVPSREYDFLMPGSGLLIFHVDERVAGLDYNYDGDNNFDDNQLQWVRDIYGNPVNRFITLVEGDGFVNFGGYYRSGFGKPEDMYRDDRNTAFTPNSNPQTIDNTGNITHIAIDNITRVLDTNFQKPVYMDSLMSFNVTTDKLVQNFPIRAGYPMFHISPIADDLDHDGNPEFIITSGDMLTVVTSDGQNFLRQYTNCTSCPSYYDSSFTSIDAGRENIVPLYAKLLREAYTVPVTGNFSDDGQSNKLIAVGGNGYLQIFMLADGGNDGQADMIWGNMMTSVGDPISMTFGDTLFVLTDLGYVFRKTLLNNPFDTLGQFQNDEYQGMCRVGDGVAVMAGDSVETMLYFVNGTVTDSINLGKHYTLGPIFADLDLDGSKELIAVTNDGDIILANINTGLTSNVITIKDEKSTGYRFTANPIISDVDLDGYPDVVIGGQNGLYAFNYELTMKTSFPKEFTNQYLNDFTLNAPIAADIESGGDPEIIFPTDIGNIYSFGEEKTNGFPLSAGEQGIGSVVYATDSTGGKLGYLGLDGWFYLWHVDSDTETNFWPMSGGGPSGSLNFNSDILPSPKTYTDNFPTNKFYNYPNPVTDGTTTIRYFLGKDASDVTLKIYDLSGREIDNFSGPKTGMVDNEIEWNCSDVTPGVYRCVISVEFAGGSETAFTDIAIIR